ncbi:unnamed protein product [Peniophora sp. CBMAI 1063]|nr:unnamed protein product [Peniophora sp. CBMAI 1063]
MLSRRFLTVPVLGEAELLVALDELQVAMAHFAPFSALIRLSARAHTAEADRCIARTHVSTSDFSNILC